MDLKRLRHALALAEMRSFARAADKLHLSQPALSRSIQTLEEEIGLLLFDRDSRNVAVTPAGEVFLEHARRVTFEMRGLERDMALLRENTIGSIAFGAGPIPMASLVPQLLRRMRAEYPGLRLRVAANKWSALLVQLRAEEIEFFISDTREITPSLDVAVTPLCRQFGPFVVRAGHPLLAKADRQLADLQGWGVVSFAIPPTIAPVFNRLLGLRGDETQPFLLECDSIALLKEAALHEDVVMVTAHAAVADDIAAGRLVVLDMPGMPAVASNIGIVQLNGRTRSPAAALLQDALGQIAATCIATTLPPYTDEVLP